MYDRSPDPVPFPPVAPAPFPTLAELLTRWAAAEHERRVEALVACSLTAAHACRDGGLDAAGLVRATHALATRFLAESRSCALTIFRDALDAVRRGEESDDAA